MISDHDQRIADHGEEKLFPEERLCQTRFPRMKSCKNPFCRRLLYREETLAPACCYCQEPLITF